MAETVPSLRNLRVDPGAAVDLAEQVRRQIAWLIASQKLAEGDRLPPVRSLASQLGIHMHTVRAAYHQLESEGLVESRRGAGTKVRGVDPRRLGAERPALPTSTVGVILPEYSPFYLPFLQGVEHAAQAHPALLLLCVAHNDSRVASRQLDELVAKGVDGIILTALPVDLTKRLRPGGVQPTGLPPVVAVDIPQADGPAVVLDGESAGEQAAEHLIHAHGHRRIGLVTAPLAFDNVRKVHDGFVRALGRHGIEFPEAFLAVAPDFAPESGRRAATRLLRAHPEVSAVLAVSDTLAIGVLQAARQLGRQVPETLAVVGYNDIELAAHVAPPLTTVAAPAYEMGEAAMGMLNTLLASGELQPERRVLPTALVVRRSCGCQAAD